MRLVTVGAEKKIDSSPPMTVEFPPAITAPLPDELRPTVPLPLPGELHPPLTPPLTKLVHVCSRYSPH